MPRFSFLSILFVTALVVIVGGFAFLALWEPSAPATKIERTLPDDRVPR